MCRSQDRYLLICFLDLQTPEILKSHSRILIIKSLRLTELTAQSCDLSWKNYRRQGGDLSTRNCDQLGKPLHKEETRLQFISCGYSKNHDVQVVMSQKKKSLVGPFL